MTLRKSALGRGVIALWLISALTLVACGDSEESGAGPEALIGSEMPALSGDDLTGTGVTELASLTGKPTAVVFWLNTCPHCQESLPEIESLWTERGDEFNILTVGMAHPDAEGDPGYETPAAFVTTLGLTLPTIEYLWADAESALGLEGVPTALILDDDHVIVDVVTGDGFTDRIEESLDATANDCCAVP